MKTWIKLYTKIVDNPDFGSLPLEYVGAWSLLLALAGRLDDRDDKEIETGRLDTPERIAWYLRRELTEIAPFLQKFQELGLLHENDGCLYISKYCELQQRPPSARPSAVRERVQRHRNKDKGRASNDVTSSMKRVPDTDKIQKRTDTEEDTDKIQSRVDTDEDTEETALVVSVHHLAESTFDRILTKTEAMLLDEMIDSYESIDLDGWRHVFNEAARQDVRKLSYVAGILRNLDKPRPGQGWYEQYKPHIQS